MQLALGFLFGVVTLRGVAGQGGFLQSRTSLYEFPHIEEARNVPAHFLIFLDGKAAYYNSVHGALAETARTMLGTQVAFIEVKNEFPTLYKFFSFHSEEGLPMAVMVNWTAGVHKRPYHQYLFSSGEISNMTADAMTNFTKRYMAGELKPWVRSEPVIEEPGTHNLRHGAMAIVASQFEKLVLDENRDVVLLFFAPWCGFCKRIMPLYDKLAQSLGHVPTLSFMKMDATQNDCAHPIMSKFTGYPFLAMFPAGGKNAAPLTLPAGHTSEVDVTLAEAVTVLRQHAFHPIPDPEINAISDGGSLGSGDEEM